MEVGRILAERYEILRPLAEGAMSTVWVAVDRTNGTNVAIKTISLDAAGWRAEIRDRFMKEARLLARGKHEHLVGVRDVGETEDGFLYLVLDLLEGETLADRLARETKLPWPEAVSLTLAIARGVAALHRAGIVHRDLKPANIVLHRTPTAVVPTIIDLGIGKASTIVGDPELCATLTATGQVLGTPQYMSYEQALGQTDIDVRADVWALGVMLYEMLTGSRPFEAPNTNAVLAAIRRKDMRSVNELVPDVPNAISSIVEICLRTNRSDRFPDAEILSDKLDEALKNPARPTTSPPPQPVLPKKKPRRAFVVAIASALAVFVVSAIFLALTHGEADPGAREIAADVNGSAIISASTLKVAADVPSVQSLPETIPVHVPSTQASATRKASTSNRNRPPVSRVDEAGF